MIDGHSFVVKGLAGKRKLAGEISVSGSKNAVLPALAASILFDGEVIYSNAPKIEDVLRMREILEALGAEIIEKNERIHIHHKKHKETSIPADIAKQFRGSIVLTGPLLARRGEVSFPHPGGCVIGERPIDLFLEGFKALGASVYQNKTTYTIKAPKGLTGAEIFLKMPSVTGTATLMTAATMAAGTTVIKNAAFEPEVVHLAHFLNENGANITGIGTSTVTIRGSQKGLRAKHVYQTPPDRIEAGSYIILAAIAGKDVTVTNLDPRELESLTERLTRAGVPLEIKATSIRIKQGSRTHTAVHIKTHEYPGFPTDLQAPMVVFLTQAEGDGHVFETIFEGRLGYAEDLVRMGAKIDVWNPRELMVHGGTKLKGKTLIGPDLRAGLAFIMAGAIATGETRVENAYFIDRGYEAIEKKLQGIGLDIQRETA